MDQSAKETAIEQWARYQTSQNQEVAAPASDELLTVEKTAHLLNVVPQTVFGWRKAGILTGYRMGHRVYFKRAEVLAALQAQGRPDERHLHARHPDQQEAR
jgi:excisionase family DNA binding protein